MASVGIDHPTHLDGDNHGLNPEDSLAVAAKHITLSGVVTLRD